MEKNKVLPKRVKKEFKQFTITEIESEKPMPLMQELEESLKQVKLIRDGKMPKKNARDIFNG